MFLCTRKIQISAGYFYLLNQLVLRKITISKDLQQLWDELATGEREGVLQASIGGGLHVAVLVFSSVPTPVVVLLLLYSINRKYTAKFGEHIQQVAVI